MPRRFTVEPDRRLTDAWQLGGDGGDYDLWLLGPGGFHGHITGRAVAHAGYDLTVEARDLPGFRRRFAGRVETGRHSLSDPAMGGPARGDQA